MKTYTIEVVVGTDAKRDIINLPVSHPPPAALPLSKYERARRGMLTPEEQRENELEWLRGFPRTSSICSPSRTGLLKWLHNG